MSLRLSGEGSDYILLDAPRFESDTNSFVLSPADGSEDVHIDFPAPYQADVPYDEYFVFALCRSEYSENDIYELYMREDGKRVGMVFPLQAAVSRDHNQAEETRFLRFAQGAFMAACRGLPGAHKRSPTSSGNRSLKIFDFYPENTIVFIIHSKALSDSSNFNISDFSASTARLGFYLQHADLDPANLAKESQTAFEELAGVKRIYLESNSKELSGVPFLASTLQRLLPYEKNPLMRFFYQYQMIELLIGIVLDRTFNEFKTQLSAAGAQSSGIRDILENLQEQLSEKKRLIKLVDEHVKPSISMAPLRTACNLFLDEIKYATKTDPENRNIGEFLYPVRNALFHNLRSVESSTLERLEEINRCMRKTICDMILRFQ
jgi:hypothetical protein